MSIARQRSSSARPKARSRRASELDALEAAEADLALERGARRDGALGAGAARLARRGCAHDVEDALHDVVEARLAARRSRLPVSGHRRALVEARDAARANARATPA